MLSLEQLGITQDELLERVVDRIAENLLTAGGSDDEGRWYGRESDLAKRCKYVIEERITKLVTAALEANVIPKAEELIANMVIQLTNAYGEKKGQPQTLTEYAAGRAEDYLMENVDYNGNTTKKPGEYGYSATQTRLCHLVKSTIQTEIEKAAKEAMQGSIGTVAKALNETMRVKLNEAANKIKVSVG